VTSIVGSGVISSEGEGLSDGSSDNDGDGVAPARHVSVGANGAPHERPYGV
jgi:hypothetical protein